MKTEIKTICTFTFQNGTKLRVAIETIKNGNHIDFFTVFNSACNQFWQGNEEIQRGAVKSFEIGDPIHIAIPSIHIDIPPIQD